MGKSCLLLRFADDTFTESYISTIGVDFVSLFLIFYVIFLYLIIDLLLLICIILFVFFTYYLLFWFHLFIENSYH